MVECEHMPVPVPLGCCSLCKGKRLVKASLRKDYVTHKEEVILSSGRLRQNLDLAMWYPYMQDTPRYESTVHVCGGWSSSHIMSLLKGNRFLHTVEFAPAQKSIVLKYLELFINQPRGAVGVTLKSRR